MAKTIAYIKATFYKEDIDNFNNLVNEIVEPSLFYSSDVVEHIKGNVTSKLHLTLFFGINPRLYNFLEIEEYVKNIKLESIELGDMFLMDGFQSLYKILSINVLDNNKELEKIYNDVKELINDERDTSRFLPHLTLAYVDNDFMLPNDTVSYPKKLRIQDVRIGLFSKPN